MNILLILIILNLTFIISQMTDLGNTKRDLRKANKCAKTNTYTRFYPKERCDNILEHAKGTIKRERKILWTAVVIELVLLYIHGNMSSWIPELIAKLQ